MLQPCEGPLCYTETAQIQAYLDLPSTRALLGVDPSIGNFSSCSSTVGYAFQSHLDKWAQPTQHYVSNLLDRGIRVLIYAGTYDWQCNWVANRLWVEKLQWAGQTGFGGSHSGNQSWRGWEVDGKTVGEVKERDGLTFATILGAGHMMSGLFEVHLYLRTNNFFDRLYVPHDKPAEALAMVSRWLAGQEL